MKLLKRAATVALIIAGSIGLAGPANAASSHGGAGTSFTITTYNYFRTGYLPSPPSSVPSTSKVTSISYNLNYTASSYPAGSLDAYLCTTTTNCVQINRFGGTVTAFNGLAATTSFQIRAQWYSPTVTGTVPGGVNVTDSITVSYS